MARKSKSPMDELWDDLGMNQPSYSKSSSKSYSKNSYRRCYEDHPPLKLPNSELVIYGGSCINPAVTDADVYIGFDSGMKMTQRSWPWKKGTEFLFKITDMSVPDRPEEFEKLVNWTIKQLEDGKKVHAGCIGGHGRTGTFFAAIVAKMGEPDAITYVREHYCTKAVESGSQIDFLAKHYGVTRATGSKSYGSTKSSAKTTLSVPAKAKPKAKAKSTAPSAGPTHQFSPIVGNGSIWGITERN